MTLCPAVTRVFGLALFEYRRPRVHGVADKYWVRQSYVIPAEIRHHVLGNIRDTLSGDQGKGQTNVYERSAKFSLAGAVIVEMDGRSVLSQQGEPDVVGCGDGPPERVFTLVADFEVLEIAAGPASPNRHLTGC